MNQRSHLPLVLGSSSPFRRELLGRLGIAFETASPDVNESPREGETAQELVRRLAEAKARAIGVHHPHALIIGSDQVAVLDGRVLGKPGNRERAIEQLRAASGQTVRFLTGLCLLNSASGNAQIEVIPYDVTFRPLDEARIARYVDAEKPFNCAGSFKSEGLGIALFASMEGNDPSALIGLPLIALVSMLEREGQVLP